MSNAERWDHSGYKDLQNEEKGQILPNKRIGNKKPFYKYSDEMSSNEKNIQMDLNDQAGQKKNQNKKFSNFSTNKFQNDDWNSDKDKIRQETDFTNSIKNKQRKKRKEDSFFPNEANAEKYLYRSHYKPEEPFRDNNNTMNKSDFSSGSLNSNMTNRAMGNRKNQNFVPNQMMQPQVGAPLYNSHKQFTNQGYNNMFFHPGYNFSQIYPTGSTPNTSSQMNFQSKKEQIFSSPPREIERSFEKENFEGNYEKSGNNRQLLRNNETNDTNVTETSINSRIHTPQRASINSINTGSNYNKTNLQNTPGNSVGFSPKNDQFFKYNMMKMPSNNMPFNSPMRQMNENLIFQNFQNTPRGMNYMGVNQQPYCISPMPSIDAGISHNMNPMVNMQGNLPNSNPINNFSPAYMNFNQSPYNNMTYNHKLNTPILDDMSNVNHELRNTNNNRKFQRDGNNNFPMNQMNMMNPNLNTQMPMMNNIPNKIIYDKPNYVNNGVYPKKPGSMNFQQMQGNNKQFMHRKNMSSHNNFTQQNLNPMNPHQMNKIKTVKSEKNLNGFEQKKIGGHYINYHSNKNEYNEKNMFNQNVSKTEQFITYPGRRSYNSLTNEMSESGKTFGSIVEEIEQSKKKQEEKGDSSQNHSIYEVTEEEVKLSDNYDKVLFVSIKLKEGEETLSISKGSDIYQTAHLFVIRNQLSLSLIKPICERIKQAFSSLESVMDLPITEGEHNYLSRIEASYQDTKEEILVDFDLSCITDLGSSGNCLGDSFSLTNEDFRKIERLNVSR